MKGFLCVQWCQITISGRVCLRRDPGYVLCRTIILCRSNVLPGMAQATILAAYRQLSFTRRGLDLTNSIRLVTNVQGALIMKDPTALHISALHAQYWIVSAIHKVLTCSERTLDGRATGVSLINYYTMPLIFITMSYKGA